MADAAQLVRQTLAEYDSVAETEIARREQALLYDLAAEPERSLLYALRVSQPGVRAKTLGTLKSRWEVTNDGAGGSGLSKGRPSRAHAECYSFLVQRFHAQLAILLDQSVATAVEKAAARKSPSAKRAVIEKAITRIESDVGVLRPPLPGGQQTVENALRALRGQLNDLAAN